MLFFLGLGMLVVYQYHAVIFFSGLILYAYDVVVWLSTGFNLFSVLCGIYLVLFGQLGGLFVQFSVIESFGLLGCCVWFLRKCRKMRKA